MDTAEDAVRGVEFVQENAPEREGLKRELLARAGRAAGADAIFCSSTSGLRPSLLQADMPHPERMAVGHPFNPVYLLPLVEVCGGERTAPETLDRAASVYRSVGMEPLVLRTEIDGFVADRLMEAHVARGALARRRRCRHGGRDRRRDPSRRGPAVVVHGHVPDLPQRRRRRRHAPLHGAVRPGPQVAVDEAHRRARADRRAASRSSWRSPTPRPAGRSIRDLERLRDDCLVAILRAARPALRRRRGARALRARAARRGRGGGRWPPPTSPGRCGCTRPPCGRSGWTTTGTPTRAATCRCSATPPTRSCS